MRARSVTMLTVLALLSSIAAFSAPKTPPAPDPRAAQFDFWLGSWDATSGGKPTGTNTITREYDGAVVMEHFVSGTPGGLNGMSVSVFNPKIGKWQQTWVDNQGAYLDFVGEFSDGKMILQRHATTPDGKDFLQRMVWFNIAAGSFDWNWERSDDAGATWKTVWPIHYQRKSKAD
jgi:hypothetical protein